MAPAASRLDPPGSFSQQSHRRIFLFICAGGGSDCGGRAGETCRTAQPVAGNFTECKAAAVHTHQLVKVCVYGVFRGLRGRLAPPDPGSVESG